jgi:micrococcal nuclease
MQYAISRRTKRLIIALILAVILLAAVSERVRQSGQTGNIAVNPNDDFANFHQKTFTVIKVVDGDTLDFDNPDDRLEPQRLRLLGIDTPETKKPGTPIMHYGPQATDETKKMCLGREVLILIDSISKTRDRYGRLLGYVLLDDDIILNEYLVENGFAYADLRFQHSYYKKYKSLAEKCRKKKIGLWKDLTEDQIPSWLIKYEKN